MRSLELFVTIGALGIGFIAICLTYTDFIFLPNPTSNIIWLEVCYIGNIRFFSGERRFVVIDLVLVCWIFQVELYHLIW